MAKLVDALDSKSSSARSVGSSPTLGTILKYILGATIPLNLPDGMAHLFAREVPGRSDECTSIWLE